MSGKKKHPKTKAGRYITADDVQRANDYAGQVATWVGSKTDARQATKSENLEEKILWTAVDVFFDDFAAAAEAVFENDPVGRTAALALIPRKPEQRHGPNGPPGGGPPGGGPPPSGP